MTRYNWALPALTVAALAALSAAASAQNPASGETTTRTVTQTTAQPPGTPVEGAGERVGSKVDRVTGAIKQGVRDTAESVRESFGKAKASVHAMNVQARVYGRIHWDKALTDEQDLNLEVARDGTVTLRGAVANANAKAHALMIARDTVGVTSVVDELTLRSATTISPATVKPGVPHSS